MIRMDGDWVEFSFFRPEAESVYLAGDFNEWQEHELPMVRSDEGYWHARMRLPAGEFKFRYCADGQWYTDFAAFGVSPGRFGLDSVLLIPAKRVDEPVQPAATSSFAAA